MLPEDRYPSPQWVQWARTFEALKDDLVDLGVKRTIHRAHQASIDGRLITDGTGIVHRWLEDNYADSMLIGLRRLLDRTRGSLSLVRLLEDLQRNHSLISLERFLGLCRGSRAASHGEDFFRLLYGQFSNGGSLDRKRVTNDIERLMAAHASSIEFTNSVVAHRRMRDPLKREESPAPTVTWGKLDQLFDDVAELFNRYYALADPGVYLDFESVLPAGFDQAFVRLLTPESGNHPG